MSKKKPHGVQLLIRLVVKDPDGKIIHDTKQKPSKSFVRNFLLTVWGIFDGATHGSYNAGRTIDQILHLEASVGQDDRGIVVGTGDTPPTSTDNSLANQLTEGVGAGNISHSEEIFVAPAIVGPNVDMVVKRPFTNSTGSTITVKEAGIYIRNTYDMITHCHVRDVLVSPEDVPDKCSLTVYYTWRTTV